MKGELRGTINTAWHAVNQMPKNPTLDQRVEWHTEHQQQCRCRPIPAKLLEQIRERSTQAGS